MVGEPAPSPRAIARGCLLRLPAVRATCRIGATARSGAPRPVPRARGRPGARHGGGPARESSSEPPRGPRGRHLAPPLESMGRSRPGPEPKLLRPRQRRDPRPAARPRRDRGVARALRPRPGRWGAAPAHRPHRHHRARVAPPLLAGCPGQPRGDRGRGREGARLRPWRGGVGRASV